MSRPELVRLGEDAETVWNEAIATLPGADASHDWRWGAVLESAYGWRPHRILWRTDGHWIAAVQFHVYPHRVRRVGVSSPFMTSGGLLVAEGADQPLLHSDLGALSGKLGLKYIALREVARAGIDHGEFTFRLELKPREAMFASFESKLRSQIRKPQKEGYVVEIAGGQELLFYGQFQRKMHEFGTPVHARRLFREWLVRMPEVCRQFVIRDPDGIVVGGMLMLMAHGRASIPFAVVHEPERRSAANMLLYWEALAHAGDAGCAVADFGRSQKDSGTYKFKLQWGGVPLPLVNSRCGPGWLDEVGFGIRGGMADRFTALWSRLPGWLADSLGPRLRRFIP